jgi:hypothetical protein
MGLLFDWYFREPHLVFDSEQSRANPDSTLCDGRPELFPRNQSVAASATRKSPRFEIETWGIWNFDYSDLAGVGAYLRGDGDPGWRRRGVVTYRDTRRTMDEVIRRPRAGELHLAVFQLYGGSRVAVLVALDALVIDEVGDVEQHLAGAIALAGDFLVERGKHAVHLNRDGAGAGLAFPLLGGVFAQAGEILFAHAVHQDRLVKFAAAVVDHYLKVHLGLAAKPVEVGQELALVGADGSAEGFVIGKDGAETERQHG